MIKVLEYDKNQFTIREFENKVQTIINDNKDLLTFSLYDCHFTNSIFVTLVFGDTVNTSTEIFTFGPDRLDNIVEQINGTQIVAKSQNKSVIFSDIKLLNKITRVVGFLIVQKSKELRNETESKKTRQNKKIVNVPDKESKQKE